tara:strand:- start:235 stop:1131 length:897 start_codon:yes stop_codon:yes gene_type:complete
MPFGYIYKIEFPNGKVYIGQTGRTLKQRHTEHNTKAKNGNTRAVYGALRKYNMVGTFELIEIDTADTKEELCEKEIGYILMYRSIEREYGYNRTIGGEGVKGYVYTEEQREKQSQATKKQFAKPGAREKHSEAQKKRFEDFEERKKCGEATKKYYEETPGAREKQSKIKKKHFAKPGEREKQSERLKKYFEKPGEREKQSEKLKKYFEKPGVKEKISERRKKQFKKPGAKHQLLDAQGKNKPFDVFTTDGTFVKTFTYQMDAREYLQKEYGITSTIKSGEVLKGRRKSSAGFVFKYKD